MDVKVYLDDCVRNYGDFAKSCHDRACGFAHLIGDDSPETRQKIRHAVIQTARWLTVNGHGNLASQLEPSEYWSVLDCIGMLSRIGEFSGKVRDSCVRMKKQLESGNPITDEQLGLDEPEPEIKPRRNPQSADHAVHNEKASSLTDSEINPGKMPDNKDVLDLCVLLSKNAKRGTKAKSEIAVARNFFRNNEKKAKNMLRQARRFPHLWKR